MHNALYNFQLVEMCFQNICIASRQLIAVSMILQGKRYVLPNTRIMLHHPSGSARGQASDIQNEAKELLRIRGYVNKMLAQATGKSIEKVCFTQIGMHAVR